MLRTRMMKAGLILAAWTMILAGGKAARAQDGQSCAPAATGCCECNSLTKCPPYVKHFYEGAPKICFKCACPKPICCQCDLEYYGYYPTCWHRWPWEPNYSHCPLPGCSGPGAPSAASIIPDYVPPADAAKMPRDLRNDSIKTIPTTKNDGGLYAPGTLQSGTRTYDKGL